MKSLAKCLLFLRRLLAAMSLLAMTAVFFIPAAARWCGFLPRLQLVPAILSGAVLELVVLAVLAVLFGRLYCSVLCPLGILQDFASVVTRHVAASTARTTGAGRTRIGPIVRYAILVLFLIAVPLGFTGLLEPYGIFGRFLAVGIRRAGEPAVVTVVWAWGLVVFILAMTCVRSRWWCNRVCPVGTFLGLISRFSLVRVKIDASKCVKCGRCVQRCAAGAIVRREDKTIAVDNSSCVMCGNCADACNLQALGPWSGHL